MLKKLNRMSLKTGVLSIVIMQSIILCLIVIVLIQALSYGYTNLVINESSEILNLYTEKIESRLKQTEKLSFDILCSREIQNSLMQYMESQNLYSKYLASTDIYTQLFTRIFNEPYVVSANFIFNDGTRVDVKVKRTISQNRDYMDTIYKNAAGAQGKNIWTVNPDNTGIISSARLIKDTSGTNGFISYGVLVINLDAEKLLTYNSVSSQKYKSDIICYADGNILSYQDFKVSNEDINYVLRQNKNWGEIFFKGSKYMFLSKNLSTTNWQFISILRLDSILSDVGSMRKWYLLCFILVVLLIAFLAIKFADMICHPVVSLSRSMMRVKEDVFDKHPTPDKNQIQIEEIVQLSESYNTMITKIDYLINEEYKKQLMISNMHYKMLQNQINPHFLYNTLETIHWKAVECGNKDISTMVMSISSLLRSSINKVDVITVEEDLKLVKDYIAIQQIRFEERLVFEVEADPSIFLFKIPKMTLQPIVENSIRHNLEKHAGVCKIKISFHKYEESFSILIYDNGKDVEINRINQVMQGEEEPSGTGLGLKNIQERIQISFGTGYGIKVYKELEEGFCVEIFLPYKTD